MMHECFKSLLGELGLGLGAPGSNPSSATFSSVTWASYSNCGFRAYTHVNTLRDYLSHSKCSINVSC